MPFIRPRTLSTLILVLAVVAGNLWAQSAKANAEFTLKWEYKNLPIHFDLYEAPGTDLLKAGTMGTIQSLKELTIFRTFREHVLTLAPGESKVLYLVAANPTKSEVRFAVAPHSTEPTEHSIGFKFNCLCNGHIYKIPPGKMWYRIIVLKANESLADSKIELKHIAFKTK